MMPTHRAVFLDRDGVLNRDRVNYVYRRADLEVLPGVPEALGQLKAAGFRLIVITNQSGIAKGLYEAAAVHDIHAAIQEACGYVLDALYFAPGHPSRSESLSRKPGTLMIERAAARFGLHLPDCWLVGDADRDLRAGQRAGVGHLVRVDGRPRADMDVRPHLWVRDLMSAVPHILANYFSD